MIRARLVFVIAFVLSMFGVLASTASAKIAFEWKVGGKALAAGEQRTFTASAESTFDLKGTLAGAALLILAGKLKVEPGARIVGGKPGTNEETVVFEGATVDRPTNCEVESLPSPVVGTIKTKLLATEIVEGQTSREPLILVVPKEGSIVAELRLLGASCLLKNVVVSATGSLLADPLPHLSEVLSGLLDFEPSQGNEVLCSNGGVETVGLILGGEPAKIGGKALMTLTSDEKFGSF